MSIVFDVDKFQHEIRVHATLMPIGFIILLPLGILIPRYARTFTNKWFYGHVGFQVFLAGPIIIAGFAMAVMATQRQVQIGLTKHFSDPHQKTGLALFILYLVQVALGLSSHLIKSPSTRLLLHRTPHQVLHIALGLAIIGLAFYQVNLGYTFEWITLVGTVPPSNVNTAWLALVIVLPILYVLGYALFPRQISQESAARRDRRNGSASEAALRKEEGST